MYREGPSVTGWRRLRKRIQDRLWTRDEEWAAEHGYTAVRSRRGWSITVRDPRWDTRRPGTTEPGGTEQDVDQDQGGM